MRASEAHDTRERKFLLESCWFFFASSVFALFVRLGFGSFSIFCCSVLEAGLLSCRAYVVNYFQSISSSLPFLLLSVSYFSPVHTPFKHLITNNNHPLFVTLFMLLIFSSSLSPRTPYFEPLPSSPPSLFSKPSPPPPPSTPDPNRQSNPADSQYPPTTSQGYHQSQAPSSLPVARRHAS